MDTVECKAKKWGSSIGVIIPHGIVEREHIKPEDAIRISVSKILLAKDLWKLGKITSSRSIEEIRKEFKSGW